MAEIHRHREAQVVETIKIRLGRGRYKHVIEENGKMDFWRVNMRPGKPVAFEEYKGVPVIGLPGNPVSAFGGFEVFVRPAIQKMGGFPLSGRQAIRVKCEEQIESDGRESYLRGEVHEVDGALVARLTGHQGSGNLHSLVQANALLIIARWCKMRACWSGNHSLDTLREHG